MKKNFCEGIRKSKRMCLFLLMSLFTVTAISQVRISGKVTGNDGNGIAGVSVVIKNTNIGTATDASGNYVLDAPVKQGNYTLEFSGVGFRTRESTVRVGSDQNYSADAQLISDALNMDEIVVIGSSLRQSRKQLGNTVNSVNSKQLANTGSGNLSASLQGKVPGAQIMQTSGDPSGGISIRMRGTSTIKGSSEPLYVIDGVIVSNSTTNVTNLNVSAGPQSEIGTNRMADINPNDIEKIDIIPGASASAIYGSRASNGVVLITTKTGKSGQLKVDFSTSIISNELRKKVYISTYGKQFGSAALRLGNISDGPATFITYTRPDGQIRKLSTDLVDVTRYDYQDQIFQKGLGTDNYISLSGGSEKTKYYFSGGYYKNEGIIRNTDFRRFNFKTRVEQTINKWLTVMGGIGYSNSFSNEKPNGNVFWSPINAINITNNLYDITQRDAVGNLKGVEPTRVNPLSVIEDMSLTQQVHRTISDLQLKVKPLTGLSIDYIFGIDNISQEGRNYIERYPYIAAQEGLGYVGNGLVNTFLINNDINISYQTKFNTFSSLTVAGFNHQQQKITGLFNEGRDLLGGISTINGASTKLDPRYTSDERQIFGGFIQQTLGYKNIFFLTAAGRIDGSTSFPKDTRTYFYPKVSASWSLSDMDLWKQNNWFTSARLRASWGRAGNLSGIGSYDRFYTYVASNINGVATYNINSLIGNEFVEPERSSEFEYGADLSFFKNKLGLIFTVYNKKIVDNSLLVDRVLAPSTGGLTRIENVGNLTNKGWELGLTANPVTRKNFSWNFSASVNHNKNLVTASSQVTPVFLGNAGGSPSVILAGHPVGVFFGNYFERDPKTDTLSLDAAGRPIAAVNNSTDKVLLRKALGDPNPEWVLSIGNSFEYKKLSFSFLLDGAFGQEVFNADRRTRQGVGIGDYSEREIKGQLPRGYIFSIYNTEEWRVESGSYLKLREVALSYQLPSFIKFIKSSSISLIGRNLISWDDYDGYDPETNAGGNSSVLRGIDFGNVPIPKTYQLTFRISL